MNEVDLTKLGTLIDASQALRLEIEKIDAEKSELTESLNDMKEQILAIMEALHITTSSADTARVSISDQSIFDIVNDDDFYDWIGENPKVRLSSFQRRLHQKNLAELQNEFGENIPGIGSFNKKTAVISKLPNT